MADFTPKRLAGSQISRFFRSENRLGLFGELNHDEQRRWKRTVVIYNRQGDSQQLRLLPDDDQFPIPDDPDIVRVRLGSIGWTNGRRSGDVWLGLWLWKLLLLLYDLTSIYFEGLAEEDDLAERGYSRDHRSDCKQVI